MRAVALSIFSHISTMHILVSAYSILDAGMSLEEIKAALCSSQFSKVFQGLTELSKDAIPVQQAKDSGIGKLVQAIASTTTKSLPPSSSSIAPPAIVCKPGPARELAKSLMNKWQALAKSDKSRVIPPASIAATAI